MRLAVGVVALVLAACGDEPAERPVPVLVGPTADLELVAVGDEITFTARILEEDGSPRTDYIVEWSHGSYEVPPGTRANPSPGVETLTATRDEIGDHQVFVRVFAAGVDVTTNPPPSYVQAGVIYLVWGGPATRVVADLDEVDLAVGETRPFSWYVYANTGTPGPSASAPPARTGAIARWRSSRSC